MILEIYLAYFKAYIYGCTLAIKNRLGDLGEWLRPVQPENTLEIVPLWLVEITVIRLLQCFKGFFIVSVCITAGGRTLWNTTWKSSAFGFTAYTRKRSNKMLNQGEARYAVFISKL